MLPEHKMAAAHTGNTSSSVVIDAYWSSSVRWSTGDNGDRAGGPGAAAGQKSDVLDTAAAVTTVLPAVTRKLQCRCSKDSDLLLDSELLQYRHLFDNKLCLIWFNCKSAASASPWRFDASPRSCLGLNAMTSKFRYDISIHNFHPFIFWI